MHNRSFVEDFADMKFQQLTASLSYRNNRAYWEHSTKTKLE